MSTSSPSSRLFSPLVLLMLGLVLVLCGVYATGLHHALIFDDARLTDGTVVQGYGEAAAFNWRRWLSYSSFIWLGLDGEVFTAQRVLNLLLHLGVCASVWALFAQLVQLLPLNGQDEAQARARRRAAVLVGVVVFALNPVAVYAVGYLIQRSIVMATGFALLSCACLVRGLLTRGAVAWAWHTGAFLACVLAVLSKEHSVMLPLVAVVLYVYVRRPSAKQLAVMGGLGALALAVCAAVMWKSLGSIVGAAAFDETSGAYLAQLDALHPGFAQQAYALSLINQAALFFVYGALWLLPNPGWLAMDLRPAFPLALTSMPQLIGALAFVALALACVVVLLRRRDGWALAAVSVLCAQLLFSSEFITTWLQDPFVLYRSYLWAAFLPGLVAAGLLGLGVQRKALLALAAVLGLVLAFLAHGRLQTLRTAELAWGDAAAKVDMQAPVNAVGRWRPFLNRGAALLDEGQTEAALADFNRAVDLGEPLGAAAMSQGMALQTLGRHEAAVKALEQARTQGMKHPMLAYHLGVSQRATGNISGALVNLQQAAQTVTDPQVKLRVLQDLGETALPARDLDLAEQAFAGMLAIEPNNVRGEIGKGMVLLGRQQLPAAMAAFDAALARQDNAMAHFGKAMVFMEQGDLVRARQSAARAQAIDPTSPNIAALLQHLQRVGGP